MTGKRCETSHRHGGTSAEGLRIPRTAAQPCNRPWRQSDHAPTGAAALGVTRSELIIEAVEQALEDRSAWSPGFLKAIGTPRSELEEAVDEMMEAIREHRSRSEAPEL